MVGKLGFPPYVSFSADGNKKCIASSEERQRIKGKAPLLAAFDYHVGLHSDIFVSGSPGNMYNELVGHRTFENMEKIRPNMALLGQLFLNKNITWSGSGRRAPQQTRATHKEGNRSNPYISY